MILAAIKLLIEVALQGLKTAVCVCVIAERQHYGGVSDGGLVHAGQGEDHH